MNGLKAAMPRLLTVCLATTALVANIFAACPDEAPDPQGVCQIVAKVCSWTTAAPDPDNGIPVCKIVNGVPTGPINACAQQIDTFTKGPFQTMYSRNKKTKTGPFSPCSTTCPCVLAVPNPNDLCQNTCVASTNVLLCQGQNGQTIVADGNCPN